MVKVPVPESVPLRVKRDTKAVKSERSTVGLAPRGKEQSLPIVIAPTPPLSMVTVLKVMLLQARVTVLDPSKVTVPPLAVKVGEPEMVKEPTTVMVLEGAVKVPAVNVKLEL